MPAIINHKICDQASACGGISVCPVGAFTYNEEKKKIEIDNEKCISCGACARSCPIGAIGVARTQEEFEELKQIIDEDPRNPDELFIDRFGGDIIDESVIIDFADLEKTIQESDNTIIELFNDDSIMCLLKSIPYSEILDNSSYKTYYRCNVEDNDISAFGLTELPSLLLCKAGKVEKVVNGYFESKDKAELFKLMK